MRALHFINLAGVLAVGVLCVAQWQNNRQLNHEINRLEAIRIDHVEQIKRKDEAAAGQSRDLETLRAHLTVKVAELKETEGKLALARLEVSQLTVERDQVKESVKNWADAVKSRDEQLKTANAEIQELAGRVNDTAVKYNELATNYNAIVRQLNERAAAYNELVTKYNELARK